MRIEQRDDAFALASRVTDVYLAADFCRASKRFSNIAGEERVRSQLTRFSRHDCVQRNDARGNQISSRFDQATGRRLDSADDVLDTSERAEPVRRVCQL